MSDNIFGHIFKAREHAYGINADDELKYFNKTIEKEKAGLKVCTNPKFIMFQITNKCNSGCVYCGFSSKNRHNVDSVHDIEMKPERISYDSIKKIIDEASDLGIYAIAYNGGEPLMHRDIEKIVAYSNEKKVLPILMTNALLLPKKWEALGEAGLKYIMISLDSLNPDVFESQRGVPLSNVMDGINAAMRMREKYGEIIIHITAVLTKNNIRELSELAYFCKKNNIWLELSVYHHMSNEEDNLSVFDSDICKQSMDELIALKRDGLPISTSEEYINHVTDFCINKKKKPDGYSCLSGHSILRIDGYLNVRPCWDSSFEIIGNLNDFNISDIWKEKKMQECRERMLLGRCGGCWNMCNEVTALFNERNK